MSILSDKEIRRLSMPPSFIVTEKVATKQNPNYDTFFFPHTVERFSWETEQQLKDAVCAFQHRQYQGHGNVGIETFRKVTEEDLKNWKPMIAPFITDQIQQDESGKRILSYGTSSYGYDVRLANKFKIFTNIYSETVIDPLIFDDKSCVDHEGDFCIIPPNSYILGHTVEYFNIPKDLMVICVGKSTLARAGAIVNVTPIEPGFSGNVVIEISNSTPLPLKIHAGMGISQFLFFRGEEECDVSYGDRNGKYQNQTGVTLAKV